MTTENFAEQWKSMQKMFLSTSLFSESFRENTRRFWENQDKILDNMQAFTNSWFDHRHTGTHSAQDAAERMCRTETIADLVQAYQDWAKGAFERIMADGLACQRQIIAATGALSSPSIAPSATEKGVEPTRPETRVPARSKAT
jgi:hypothetical protein